MIYKKDANFPYPLLTNTSSSYKFCNFILDVDLKENVDKYRFEIEYEIDSPFINALLEKGQAQLVLVTQSKDNRFFDLDLGKKHIGISKSRISLSKRTEIQLFVKSNNEISFENNNDLDEFYSEFKDEIIVPKNSILAFSNIVIFDGSNSKPLDLFEKKLDPSLKSDIKIEISNETIIINYKNEDLQFTHSPISSVLNSPYVYMGLQKALYKFIVNNSEDGDEVDLDKVDVPTDGLDLKLYRLMKMKMINELSMENIDEVIYKISDRILEKYVTAVRGLSS